MQVNPNCLTSYKRVREALALSETYSGGDVDVIKMAINDASSMIIRHVGRDLKYTVITDEKHDSRGKDKVFVDHWPIISLDDFYDDPNRDYNSDDQLTVADDEIEIMEADAGVVRRVEANFSKGQKNLKIDYKGGFSEFWITPSNNKFDINEGSGEQTVTLTTGKYNASTLPTQIKTQLDAVSSGTYTASYDATLHLLTMTKSTGTFSILWNTGTNSAIAAEFADLIGFSSLTDDTGVLSYTSDVPIVGVPADLEQACVELVLWNYRRIKERLEGVIAESRGDQSFSFDASVIPLHIRKRLEFFKHRRVG